MSEPMYCVNHPKVETYLRCNKCNQPMCSKCAVQTPVGYRCRNCISGQQKVFYSGFSPTDYLIAAAVALPLALVAGWIVPSLGWYAIVLGPVAGGGIAEAARWAIRRRRGPYTWLVVCGCIVAGSLPWLLFSLLSFVGPIASRGMAVYAARGIVGMVWYVVYVAAAAGAAYAALRPGRRT
jgi:hypothetical protein